jgi:hypothetical protein
MAYTLPTAFVKTYEQNFVLLQQLYSECRSRVIVKDLKGQKHYIDFIDTIDPVDRTGSNAPTVHQNIAHTRTRIISKPRDSAVLVDRNDLMRMGTDPTNDYMQAIKAGFERKFDSLILAAALGNRVAVTGDDETESNVALPATQIIEETGTLGLTLDKINEALFIFNDNKVPGSEEKMLGISAKGLKDLINEVMLLGTQADLLVLRAVEQGQVQKLFGFNLYLAHELPAASANIRSHVAWIRRGMGLGILSDVESRITEESQFNFSMQLWGSADVGASRLQEKCVVSIQSYEA